MPEYAAPLAISAITGLGFFGYKLALETASELDALVAYAAIVENVDIAVARTGLFDDRAVGNDDVVAFAEIDAHAGKHAGDDALSAVGDDDFRAECAC